MEKRYYYKHKTSGQPAYNLKEPLANILPKNELKNYIEITVEEWESLNVVAAIEPTEEELRIQNVQNQIAALKHELATTDYIACKLAEVDGDDRIALKQEYATQLAHRQSIRDQINDLEAELEPQL